MSSGRVGLQNSFLHWRKLSLSASVCSTLGLGEDDVGSANKVIKGTMAVTRRAPCGPGALRCHPSHRKDTIVRHLHEASDKFLALVLFVFSFLFVCFCKNVGTWVLCSHIWGSGTREALTSCQLWDSDSSCVQRTIQNLLPAAFPFPKGDGSKYPVSRLLG